MLKRSQFRRFVTASVLVVSGVVLVASCVTSEKAVLRPPSTRPSLLRFKTENYFGRSPRLELRSDGWIYVDDRPVAKPTRAQWMDFLTVLSEVNVWDWYPTYTNNRFTDGLSWDVEIKWDENYVHSVGSNDYPGCVPGMVSCLADTPFAAVVQALNRLANGALSKQRPAKAAPGP